jgi:hypothetical protein
MGMTVFCNTLIRTINQQSGSGSQSKQLLVHSGNQTNDVEPRHHLYSQIMTANGNKSGIIPKRIVANSMLKTSRILGYI